MTTAAAPPAAARLRFNDLARLSTIGLRTRKLRAALSALGIAIGVGDEGLALLDGDDAVLADLGERLGDELADRRVLGGDRRDVRDRLLALDRGGDLVEFVG